MKLNIRHSELESNEVLYYDAMARGSQDNKSRDWVPSQKTSSMEDISMLASDLTMKIIANMVT